MEIKPANSTFPAQKFLVYGIPGIGKTLFGSTFRNPVLLPVEDGASAIDIMSLPVAVTYEAIIASIDYLVKTDLPYNTLVIDSLDWIEPLVWDAVCRENGKTSIEAFGYGKGYIECDKLWRYIMGGLDYLRHLKGMDIVVLAHSEIKTVSPPDTDQYDTYQIKMQKRAFALWTEWAETVLFLNYKVNLHKTSTGINQERVRGIGTGDRVIYTSERPAYKAKSRWPLPDEILIGKDKTWSEFHKQFEAATGVKYINPLQNKEKK